MANGFGSLYIGASGLEFPECFKYNIKQPCKRKYQGLCTSAGFTGRQKLYNLQYNCIDQPAAVRSWHEDR